MAGASVKAAEDSTYECEIGPEEESPTPVKIGGLPATAPWHGYAPCRGRRLVAVPGGNGDWEWDEKVGGGRRSVVSHCWDRGCDPPVSPQVQA